MEWVPTMSLWQLLSVLLQDQVEPLAVLSLVPLYLSFQFWKKKNKMEKFSIHKIKIFLAEAKPQKLYRGF